MRLILIIMFLLNYLNGYSQTYRNFKIINHKEKIGWTSEVNSQISYSYWLRGLKPDYLIEPKWIPFDPYMIPIEIDGDSTIQSNNYHDCIQISEGDMPKCLNYLIVIRTDSVMVDSEDKFKKIYAPIENKQEAISYLFALTDYYPIFDLGFLLKRKTIDSGIKIRHKWIAYLPEIETSYIHETKDGYELLLFRYQEFGCDHPYFSAIFELKRDGSYSVRDKKKAFEDIQEPTICVD